MSRRERITRAQVAEVLRYLAQGLTYQKTAQMTGLCVSSIGNIKQGKLTGKRQRDPR